MQGVFMGKKFVFSVMLACLLALKTTMALFAQTSGNEQRLVGSWTGLWNTDISLTFNANGTMSISGLITFDDFMPTHWAAAGDRLLLFIPAVGGRGSKRAIRYFHISSDGRTLIISTIATEGSDGSGNVGGAYRRN